MAGTSREILTRRKDASTQLLLGGAPTPKIFQAAGEAVGSGGATSSPSIGRSATRSCTARSSRTAQRSRPEWQGAPAWYQRRACRCHGLRRYTTSPYPHAHSLPLRLWLSRSGLSRTSAPLPIRASTAAAAAAASRRARRAQIDRHAWRLGPT
eukprot:scaffold93708_cov72-Phaeocystis_antarctica.AAC.9